MNPTDLHRENEALRLRLAEAEEALRAIRKGDVDAIIVDGPEGAQIFSLSGADAVYRRAVETMGEGVLNLALDGTILFCNERFANFLNTPTERLIGHKIGDWIAPEHHEEFEGFIQRCALEETKQRVPFLPPSEVPRRRPLFLTGTPLNDEGSLCLVAADLRDWESAAHQVEALRISEDRLQRRIRQLDVLAGISQHLICHPHTEQETLETAFRAVAEAIGAEIFFHYQPLDAEMMRLRTWGGLTHDQWECFSKLRYGELLCGQIAERRQMLIVEDIAHSTMEGTETVRAAGYSAYAGFPLIDGDDLLGTVAFITREKTHFAEGEVQLIQTICDQVVAMLKRTRLTQQLQESEERYRLALESADLGSWDVDLRSGAAVWNRRHAELQGYEPDAVPATLERWLERIHPDDAERVSMAVERAGPTHESVALEHRVLTANTGEVRWLSLYGRFVHDASGRPFRFIGVSRDITARKEMEEALRRNEELARQRLAELESLYRNTPVGLCVLDPDLRFVRINDRLAEINGVPAEDHIGRSVREVVPVLADVVESQLQGVLTTGVPMLDVEVFGETPAAPGVIRSWLEQWLPIKDAQGRVVGLSIVAEETTERKRAETALRESQERLQLATAAAELGVFEWEAASDTPHWENERIFEIMGRTPAEGPLSREEFCANVLLPDDLPSFEAALSKALHPGQLFRTACRIRRCHDEEQRWIEFSGRFSFAPGESPNRLVGVVEDITERRIAEEKIRHQAELLDRVSDAIVATDSGFRITSWNKAAERIYGWTAAEVLGCHVDDLLRTEFVKTSRESAIVQLHAKGYGEITAIHHDRSGEEHHVESNVVLLRDSQGRQTGTLGVLRDVTARTRAEAALKEARERLETALNASQVILFHQDRDLRYTWIHNPGPGYNSDGILGKRDVDVFARVEDAARTEELKRSVLETGQPRREEVTLWAADGARAQVYDLFVQPERDSSGTIVGIMCAAVDITAQKEVEAQLARALQQTKLLFSEVHHRVKNNLQILSSLINLQAEDLRAATEGQFRPFTPEELFAAFADLRDRVRSMALVHERLYRSESLGMLDFADYAGSLLQDLWRAHHPGPGIRLDLELHPVQVTHDQAVPCGLILNELALNCLNHAFQDRSSGTVSVSVSEHPADPSQICLRVSDDGVGIPPSTNWRETHNLGLRLVLLLTKQLRGTVELYRPESGGTRFEVVFPAQSGNHCPQL